eukprot:2672149-Pleurochrysis_carterae.AAC.1
MAKSSCLKRASVHATEPNQESAIKSPRRAPFKRTCNANGGEHMRGATRAVEKYEHPSGRDH